MVIWRIMLRGQERLSDRGTRVRRRLTGDSVCAAVSVRVASVARLADTLGAVGPGAAHSPGGARIGQVAGVLALPVITNLVVGAHKV